MCKLYCRISIAIVTVETMMELLQANGNYMAEIVLYVVSFYAL